MNVIVTGGQGFLGTTLVGELLDRRELKHHGHGRPVDRITVVDAAPREATAVRRLGDVRFVTGDIRDDDLIRDLLNGSPTSIFHLASAVSAQAEVDWAGAVDANVNGLITLLRACVSVEPPPTIVFASSLAAVCSGSQRPGAHAPCVPASTYGMTKAVAEIILADASRRGIVDARVARLPTVIVRTGPANRAASGFVSAIFRDAPRRQPVVVPVPESFSLLLIGARTAVDSLIRLHDVKASELSSRTVNLYGVTATVGELVDSAVERYGADVRSYIRFDTDSQVAEILQGWPTEWSCEDAAALGLPRDASLRTILDDYERSLSTD